MVDRVRGACMVAVVVVLRSMGFSVRVRVRVWRYIMEETRGIEIICCWRSWSDSGRGGRQIVTLAAAREERVTLRGKGWMSRDECFWGDDSMGRSCGF